MQKFALAILFSASLFGASTLDNAKVIDMVKAGIDEPTIIQTINNSPTASLGAEADDLIALKKAGVSNAIIAAISARKQKIGPASTSTPSGALSPFQSPGPNNSFNGGLQVVVDNKPYATINSQMPKFNGPTTRQVFMRAPRLTGRGHLPAQDRTVSGAAAQVKIPSGSNIVFQSANLDGLLTNATLVVAKVKNNERFLYATEDGSSMSKADKIELAAHQSGDGKSVILTPKTPLAPGQYAIVSNPALRVYCFEITEAEGSPQISQK